MKIAFIGAGNLATNLAKIMHCKGFDISQVYSRTMEAAKKLAAIVDAAPIDSLSNVIDDVDLYIISVKDSALLDVINNLCNANRKGIFVHTAGSIPMNVFENHAERYGVLYPMQSFSKQKEVCFKDLPFFLEAKNDMILSVLKEIVGAIDGKTYVIDSNARKSLHLAAVFACNFVNHCYELSHELLQKHGIPFEVMLPLIDETARKVHSISPILSQTGPAVRYDENVISMQHEYLSYNPRIQEIYDVMSKSIHEVSTK